ncbi:zinc-binding metallopeptidase family protein [Rhizobium paknamense]|uniref:Zinc-ribbon domain-containing protein n=1 Tax=Rhizobium paknamense TaxID=1206817 RepID=A0ABU0ILU9_9HYPH|nr:putative zinc-binding metallopeptidase [Rhizobium paknamense]MDQ0458169.1 hypothetical protein [Rhizobium paknamense]
MRLFSCTNCHNTVYFDNDRCLACQSRLAFRAETLEMVALGEDGQGLMDGQPTGESPLLCANAAQQACNWVADEGETFCRACRHNLVIPDLSQPDNLDNWRKIEQAKHVLFYSLLRFNLPLETRDDDHPEGLAFEFLVDDPALNDGQPVMTGHDRGLITLNIAEASDAEREARRVALGEPFRTLIGHFRHEIGHYYWNVLVRDGGRLNECRAVFGNDEADYGEALKRHYAEGPVAGWEQSYISAYAASHPWEDFAECWAHYVHMVDALETAYAFGLKINPAIDEDGLDLALTFDPYRARNVRTLISAWVPLTVAINSINRSMGQPDLYPFILSEPVIAKLDFIHRLICGR